jgi:hypothetical protein
MKKLFLQFLVIVLLICAVLINYYYWTVSDIDELRYLPPYLLTGLIVYIGTQLLKRYLKKKIAWYDWLYYVGLIAVVLPLLAFFGTGDWLFAITSYGVLFFLVSPLIELIQILRAKSDKDKFEFPQQTEKADEEA